MEKKKLIKLIVFAMASILGVVIALLPPPEGLGPEAMRFLGVFIWWIAMMCIELIPTYMSSLAACALCVAVGAGTASQAFGSFGSTTCWLLIGAFGLAGGLGNSGLMKRLALNVMRLFPGTFKGQMVGMAVASLVVAPCIPSTAAKCSILVPLSGVVSDEMGYAPHSKGTVGLFSVTQMITNFAGVMFLTGGLIVPSVLAVSGASMTWFDWFKTFLPWGIVMVALILVFNMVWYNPKKEGVDSKLDKEVLKQKCAELGPMGNKEKIALAVLVVTIFLWVTEGILHSIPTFVVALGAWIVLSAAGLFSYPDFCNKILWSIFVLVGAILGMLTMISTTGVSSWLASLVAPAISSVSSQSVLLLLVIIVFATLAMFALVNSMVTGALFVTLLAGCGIAPVIIAFVTFMAAGVYVLNFQQVTVISALGVSQGRVEHKDIVPTAWAYIVIQTIAVLVSIPWWNMLGLM